MQNPANQSIVYAVNVVVCKMEDDRTVRPLKISVADGKIESLLPGHPVSVNNAVLSPDGRWLAFQEIEAVRVKSIQSGDTETIVPQGNVADWTLDGRSLVFGAPRNNVFSLFTVAVRDGHPAGAPTFIRSLGGNEISTPHTSGTSLIFADNVAEIRGAMRVYTASLDAEGRLSEWSVLRTLGRYASYPVFSPDGGRIAYILRSRDNSGVSIRLYSLANGEDRELYRSENSIGTCVWAAVPPVLYCSQPLPAERKTAILSVDIVTGRAETLIALPGQRIIQELSPDERTIQMQNLRGPTQWPRWQIGADHEDPGEPDAPYKTRDGRFAFRVRMSRDNRLEWQIRPGSAGDDAFEHLVYIYGQYGDVRGTIPVRFTPDGEWIAYRDVDDNGKDALFRVRLSGDRKSTRLNSSHGSI